jgi:hypothetical protein
VDRQAGPSPAGETVALELDDLVKRHDDLSRRAAELRRHL